MSADRTAAAGADDLLKSSAPAEGRTGIDLRRFPWIRPLAGEYAFNYPSVADLYAGNPSSPADWRAAIARVRGHSRDSRTLSAIVAAQQERRGAPPDARAAAARLADTSTVAIVTGQQAGGFGGPMFTLLKAVTAIQLARKIAAEHQATVVPVFWVDAEDHDWEEVASCTVLDSGFQPRTITIAPPDGAGDLPVAALRLDERIIQSLDELSAVFPQTEFTDDVIGALRAAYCPGAGMAAAFATWLESVLGAYGLVVFESSDPAAKPLVRDIFTRELRQPGKTAALAARAGDALAALGHDPQVIPTPDSISLFHLDGGRRPIRRQENSFLVGESTFTAGQLAAEADESPTHFSPNVLLRPIVQDALFPTICYVAGPSELAYLGQLGGVYEHFGVPMPIMYPRATATLVDSAAARFLRKYDVPLEDLQPQDESALNRLLETQLPESVEHALKEADEAIARSMERVVDALPALDPTLAGAAKTTLGRMQHDMRGLHTKVIHAAKRRDETLRRQFVRAQTQAFPLGHPQERTLAVVFFLNRYGPALVDRLFEELPLELGRHWILTI